MISCLQYSASCCFHLSALFSRFIYINIYSCGAFILTLWYSFTWIHHVLSSFSCWWRPSNFLLIQTRLQCWFLYMSLVHGWDISRYISRQRMHYGFSASSTLLDIVKLLFNVMVPVYIHSSSVWEFQMLQILLCLNFNLASLLSVKCQSIVYICFLFSQSHQPYSVSLYLLL